MPVAKLKQFLDRNKVKYVTIQHSPAYTAQEIAATAHISGKEVAKTVMVTVDDELAMAVVPATAKVDFARLKKAAGAKKVKLASEQEFENKFPECELGAMPPFGNLYDMKVFVAKELTADEDIAFNAGTHSELVRLPYGDFERLVKPEVLDFAG